MGDRPSRNEGEQLSISLAQLTMGHIGTVLALRAQFSKHVGGEAYVPTDLDTRRA